MSGRYIPNDRWSRKAKIQGYRARSVYKLKELDEKFKLLSIGQTVLDLGAAPGSWLQYVSQKIGPKGSAIGIDLTPIKPIAPNVTTVIGDINDFGDLGQFDLVLSDAAPKTTGIAHQDQKNSVTLGLTAFSAAQKFLKPEGKFVVKVFRGRDFPNFIAALKSHFSLVRAHTTHASRQRSHEIYVVCQ